MWGLAPPLARASNEWFLSQIFQAELSLRLETAGSLPPLAASAAGHTFSILLEVTFYQAAQALGKLLVRGHSMVLFRAQVLLLIVFAVLTLKSDVASVCSA